MLGSSLNSRLLSRTQSEKHDKFHAPVRSVSVESLGSKQRASVFNCFPRWRLNIVERVVEFKFLPFESAHLVKVQDVDSFHITQARSESGKLRNVSGIVLPSWHKHVA